jgi:hypothetical protein
MCLIYGDFFANLQYFAFSPDVADLHLPKRDTRQLYLLKNKIRCWDNINFIIVHSS